MDKKELRKQILSERRAMSDTDVHDKSLLICDNIRKSHAYSLAKDVCLYMPINNEVDVALMIDDVLASGRRVWLPKIVEGSMDFYHYDRETPVVLGAFEITEPDSDEVLEAGEATLVIMPGAVFSETRDRIGYGGGYYDIYLDRHPEVMTVAACFDMQIVESIPAELHDVKPQAIVSEKRIIEE
ncbi:MAG: 5-formyltetrahydrofolate cyclo-ligase [Firmicutes bacterium]|nr:5-formyltetrahydrofolate cyclo-ligase [Bacillota bacterium]